MKELGENLKRARVSNGVSIAEAAEDLELSTAQLQNIENGNVKAFKDIYTLKQYIRQYAKYLGVDCDKAIDKFDDFLFEHTSKLSLDDIKAAQKNADEKVKRVKSPYTKVYKEKLIIWPFIVAILVCCLLILAGFFIFKNRGETEETRVDELIGYEEVIYELA